MICFDNLNFNKILLKPSKMKAIQFKVYKIPIDSSFINKNLKSETIKMILKKKSIKFLLKRKTFLNQHLIMANHGI